MEYTFWERRQPGDMTLEESVGFLDSSQIPERNIERLSPSPEYVFLNVPPRFRTFLKKSVNELNS